MRVAVRLSLLGNEAARRRARLGSGAGRGRARRSCGASCVDGAGLPRADGPRAATPALPTGGAVVHALAGAPWSARSARRVAARQRMVASGQRAPAAGWLRDDRAPRWPDGTAVLASRAPLSRVQRDTDRALLVPITQREHCGWLPGASGTRDVESALERFFMNVALVRVYKRKQCAGAGGEGGGGGGGQTCAPEPLSARPRHRALYRGRAASRPDARLRGDRAAPATPVRVVRRGARRTAPA